MAEIVQMNVSIEFRWKDLIVYSSIRKFDIRVRECL